MGRAVCRSALGMLGTGRSNRRSEKRCVTPSCTSVCPVRDAQDRSSSAASSLRLFLILYRLNLRCESAFFGLRSRCPRTGRSFRWKAPPRRVLPGVTKGRYRGQLVNKCCKYGPKRCVPFVQHARENTPDSLWAGLFFIACEVGSTKVTSATEGGSPGSPRSEFSREKAEWFAGN
jgi:hypothetical protein